MNSTCVEKVIEQVENQSIACTQVPVNTGPLFCYFSPDAHNTPVSVVVWINIKSTEVKGLAG